MSERFRDVSVGVSQNFLGDNVNSVTSLWHQMENTLSIDISEEQVKLSIFETCGEEVWWIYWQNENAADRQEDKRKNTEKVYGCSKQGHQEHWCDRRGCQGYGYVDRSAVAMLKGPTETRKRTRVVHHLLFLLIILYL